MTTETPQAGPFRLLALAENASVVNRTLSSLRHLGMDLHASHAATLAEADALLAQDSPELLLCFDSPAVAVEALPDLLRKHHRNIPLIHVTTTPPGDDQLPALYAQGVTHIVAAGEPGRLNTLILQEARHGLQQRHARRLELELRELQQRHERLVDDCPLAVAYVRDGMHLHCNDAYASLLGCASKETACATPLLDLVPAAQRDALRTVLERARQSDGVQHFIVAAETDEMSGLQFNFTPVSLDGQRCLQVTVQVAAGNAAHAKALQESAARDTLTLLDSRSRFLARIESAIRRAIHQNSNSALIVLDLDNFDEIAATVGRAATSRLLQTIAAELPHFVTTPFTAGRLDLHCFGILLEDSDPDRTMDLCRRLEDGIRGTGPDELAVLPGLQASTGMMLVNGNALDAEDLIAKARLAGRSLPQPDRGTRQYRIGDSMDADTGDMLAYLNKALEMRRFKPVFQPIVGLGEQSRRCYELLIRMLDLDDNEIPPGDFIPLATINGLGEALDRLVTDIAIEALMATGDSHQVNINLTESTLLSHTFLPWLSNRLRATPQIADRLLVDISEISLHALPQAALQFCDGLVDLGIGLTISNFGCAVDPVAFLHHLKPCFVTLDSRLVRNLMYSPQDQARVKSLIEDLHVAGLEVVIPRVENMATLPLLWELGADYIQGYSVQAPSHAMDFEFVQDQEITLTAPATASNDPHAG